MSKKKRKKGIDSEPVYSKNYLKNKVKSLDAEIKDFYDKKRFKKLKSLIILVK